MHPGGSFGGRLSPLPQLFDSPTKSPQHRSRFRRPRPRPPPSPVPATWTDSSNNLPPSSTSSLPPSPIPTHQPSLSPNDIERRIDIFLEKFRRATHHVSASKFAPPATVAPAAPIVVVGTSLDSQQQQQQQQQQPFRRSRSALSPISSPAANVSPTLPNVPRFPRTPTRRPTTVPPFGPAALMALPKFLRRSLPAFYDRSPPSSTPVFQHVYASSSEDDDDDVDEPLSDDGMDDTNTTLSVRDVADMISAHYALLTGGKSRDGYPIITFPDQGNFHTISDEDYRRLIAYLTSVPPLEESDLGFVLIVDRRTDKWNSVKTVLLKISGYFPALIHVVYVLQPAGFFQKAISEVSNKLFKDEFKFRVAICNCVDDLLECIDRNQLTKDLDGCIAYDHQVWIDRRTAVEKFSLNMHEISIALRNYSQRLQETEFPNDVASTEELLQLQGKGYSELKNDLKNAACQGENILQYVRQPPKNSSVGDPCPDRLINAAAVERLLLQLEETEHMFDEFWSSHSNKLQHCLELRRFEQDFREQQANFDKSFRTFSEMTQIGDSVAHVDALLKETTVFQEQCLNELQKAEELCSAGTKILESDPEAVDRIQPKCFELRRVADLLRDKTSKRLETLRKSRELHDRIEKANRWCAQGVELLASQQIEKCSSPLYAEKTIGELEEFLACSADLQLNPYEMRSICQEMGVSESKALVQQVIQRIDDIQTMCEKRKMSLRAISSKPTSPKTVHLVPLAHTNGNQTPNPAKVFRKAKTVPKFETPSAAEKRERRNSSSPDSEGSFRDPEALKVKQGHVMAELLDTERIYVAELASVIAGYKVEMGNLASRHLLPAPLVGRADVLFGNLEDIYRFHSEVFLCDLDKCIRSTELVALCFLRRRDSFHQLYSYYCQNHPQSEALRREVGEQNPFFQDCQKRLGHKLPLGAYLLKPVQRITKYQLLLKDLIKYSEDEPGLKELNEALDCMLIVLKCVNDSMHQVAITGFPGSLVDQGNLLLHSSFRVWTENKKERLKSRLKPCRRHVFLHAKAIIFCKELGRDKIAYQFKNYLKMSQVGLTETVQRGRGDQRRFEVWLQGRQEVYTLHAPTMEVKGEWVAAIKKLLFQQLELLRGESIRHFTAKFGVSALNGTGAAQPTSPPLGQHRPLRQTTSWEHSQSNNNLCEAVAQPPPRPRGRLLSVQDSAFGSISTDRSASLGDSHTSCDEEELGWSTEFSNSEDEDDVDAQADVFEGCGRRYVVLADYMAMDRAELSLREGDVLDVLKVGCAGWWFVRVVGTGREGWAPSAYLGRYGKNTRSSPSASSQDSGMGNGLLRAGSRTSVSSVVSLN